MLLSILNFESHAIRCRPAWQLRAGIKNEQGALVGLTIKEACLNNMWSGSIIIGVQPPGDRGAGMGLCPTTDYKIEKDDYIIFISLTSMPKVDSHPPRLEDLASKELTDRREDSTIITGNHKSQQNILICGEAMQSS